MKYFDLILLVIGMIKINMAQHWYEMKSTCPMFIHSCNEKYVNSLLLCAALGREAKSVTFFSNSDTNLCRWNCTFIFSTDVSDEKSKWQKYEIKSRKNAALNKPNTVSSVHENNYGRWSPSYATDGIIQRGGSTFFHSSFETSPWIRIDLQEVSTIFFLRVYMRDGAGERFHDVAVEVTNSSNYEQRGFYKGPAMTSEVVEIFCEYPTIARYVRLRITKGSGNSLNIPELEIYTK